ncbi:hypothetical protein ACIFUY_23940 [Streptomyces sp. CACIS-1.16CA]|uniref:hypothetical protein n=1 Tax=Streptomyces sp. CACIS-1.16CA TaxID=1175510 RepID=UPI0037D2F5D8
MVAADSASTSGSLIVSVLSAVTASVIGIASLWFQEWRARRSAEVRRRRQLDEARAYLGFLTDWFTTRTMIEPNASIASTRAWAASVLSRQLYDLHTSFSVTPHQERTRFWPLCRKLLLLYPLRSLAGSLVRLVFYLVAIIVFSVTPGLLLDKDNAWGDRIGASLLLMVTGVGCLYGLWRLVARLSPGAGWRVSQRRG